MTEQKQYNRVLLGRKNCFAAKCREENFIGVDFLAEENLTDRIPDTNAAFNIDFVPIWLADHPDKSKTTAALSCGYLWTIAKGLKIGDMVLCPDGTGYYHIGIIDSEYYYVANDILPHRRKVKWLNKLIARADMTERLRNSTGSIGTCCDITKYSDELKTLVENATEKKSEPDSSTSNVLDIDPVQDLELLMKETHEQLSNKLADEILDYVQNISPEQFEKLVLQLLVKMGYGEARHTGKTNDEGIDGIIDEDKLGIDEIHIQAKRYKIGNNISRDTLQAFVGALAGKNSHKGIFITTSDFTKHAKEYVPTGVRLVKINGVRLAKLMIEYNLGVRTKETYEIKSIDKAFFD